ncbi:hypothetical protein AC579_8981 [Pseudocercospora musae]|uniref:Uncharacterized protein n=1 Tax=Pseudocercospora musae TaxID=113226 RepID=A0A139HNQ0_9PEZI|nr:hypothetical protein AC579_8981 [Pseudocercospora musae]
MVEWSTDTRSRTHGAAVALRGINLAKDCQSHRPVSQKEQQFLYHLVDRPASAHSAKMEADRTTGSGSQQQPAQQAQQAPVNLMDTESEREKAIEETTGVTDLMAGPKLVDMTEAADVNSTEAADEDFLDAKTKRRRAHFSSSDERPAPKSSMKGKSKAEVAPVPITAMHKESLASVQDIISKRCRFEISLAEMAQYSPFFRGEAKRLMSQPRTRRRVAPPFVHLHGSTELAQAALINLQAAPQGNLPVPLQPTPTKESSKVPQIFGAGGNSKKTDTAHFLPPAPGPAPVLDDAQMQFPDNNNKDKDNDTIMSNAAKKATVENVAEETLLVEHDINRIMNLNYLSDKVKLQVVDWRKRDRVNKALGMPVRVWSDARPDLGVSIDMKKCFGDQGSTINVIYPHLPA